MSDWLLPVVSQVAALFSLPARDQPLGIAFPAGCIAARHVPEITIPELEKALI